MATQLLGVGLALVALIPFVGRWAVLPAWSGLAFLVVAFCYATHRPRALGKSPDGRISPLPVVVLAPYFLLTWVTWHIVRIVSRERPWDRLNDAVALGRRPLSHEVPEGVATILDLTAEFPESMGVRTRCRYVSFPILDGSVPEPSALRIALSELPAAEGGLLIHCAQGHGRTAMVATCLALHRGWAPDAESAERMVLAARPGARMSSRQRAFVRTIAASLGERSSA